jgi:hypothetical protein
MGPPFKERFTGRHPECRQCVHFKPNAGSIHCLNCGAGEFFEEKVDDEGPDEDDLRIIFSSMDGDYD